jgi:hypothetical protein
MSQNHRRITSRNTFFINIIIFINNPTVGTVLTERYTGLLGEPQFGVHRSQACQEGCKDLESEQCADPASLGKPLDHIVQDQLSLDCSATKSCHPGRAAAPAASAPLWRHLTRLVALFVAPPPLLWRPSPSPSWTPASLSFPRLPLTCLVATPALVVILAPCPSLCSRRSSVL